MIRAKRHEAKYLQLALSLLSPSHAGWWTMQELMRATDLSRASVYRGMNELAVTGLHIERASEVVSRSEAHLGFRCAQVLAMRKRQ